MSRFHIFHHIKTDIGVGVTAYFEQIKTLNLYFSNDILEDTVSTAFYSTEKPLGVNQNTWDECLNLMVDGIAIGVYMSMIELMYCDLEDVMAVVLEIITAVFQRVQDRFGQIIQVEMDIAEDAARKIQGVWRNAISNPSYDVCKRRLMNEFNSMQFI